MNRVVVSFQILTITIIGAFTGAMIMLYTAILAFWEQATYTEFLNWYANYASGIMDATGPLLMSSIILPLISTFLVRNNPKSRKYWTISFFLCGIIMIITLSYFVDVNATFSDRSIEITTVKDTLNTWGNLHLVRISLTFISTIVGSVGLVKYLQVKANN